MKVAEGHIHGSRGKTLAPGSYKVSSLLCAASEALPCMTASWITVVISFLD